MTLLIKRLPAAILAAVLMIPLLAAPSFAVGTETETSDSFDIRLEMRLARGNLKSESYRSAITRLKKVIKAEPRNADAYNLLGFASRKLKKYNAAGKYYARALQINANHVGALEYQAELFKILNQPDKAAANLARAKAICDGDCTDLRDAHKVGLSY